METRNLGWLQLYAASEHFSAIARLYALEPAVVYSDRVLLRAGIEAAARSFWLLDPTLSYRQRIARGVTERLYSLHYTRSFAAGVEIAEHDGRRETLCLQAESAGLIIERPGKQPMYAATARRPSATDAMSTLLGDGPALPDLDLGRMSQRYLSMFVHSTGHGLLSLADASEARSRSRHGAVVPLVSTAKDACQMMGMAVVAYLAAASPALEYYGWSEDTWRKQVLNASVQTRRHLEG
jgi:hypothetical protein